MIYIVTGTPGTGKTTFAKGFAQKNNCQYIDGNEIIKKYILRESFDEETQSYIVDEEKFADACVSEIQGLTEDAIIDSHLSQYMLLFVMLLNVI
jgi:broad-specificity NMP kinase